MKLIVISGRSGSGKSTALRALEDSGYNCIDNFPVDLLPHLIANATRAVEPQPDLAVCIDARNPDLEAFPQIIESLRSPSVDCEVIFLDAQSATLVKRFSETRRRHPLTGTGKDLLQAIESEDAILQPIAGLADLSIDTTTMRGSALTELVRSRIAHKRSHSLSLLFRSFGFKFGVPVDADFVFDIRCLPNPYWDESLRPLTGKDGAVASFLEAEAAVGQMFSDIQSFLERWIAAFEKDNRAYMNIALGCTGGQHRSVYMAEKLAAHFSAQRPNVLVRHRELAGS